MAVTSWRNRHQNIRSGRIKQSRQKQEDVINLKLNPSENIIIVLKNICQIDISTENLLNYLNGFVKLALHIDGKFEENGCSVETILCCLRVTLTHTSTQIRSGGLRCIRHVLKSEEDVIILNKLLIPFLITRSLDLIYKNDVERVEAMKLIRKILILSPGHFDISMARGLVALANEGVENKDRMLRICLATLSELGVLNSKTFILSRGVAAITRNLLECQTPKIAESLCGVLLLMLDRPETRNYASVDLHSVAAPFCDFHFRHPNKDKDKNRLDERELRLNCGRLALLTILRSWSGIMHFCNPNDNTGFKAIVDVLYLNQLEVRKSVLDLLYELLGLPQPEWTDELSVALTAVDPCEPQASWRLNEGFVAAEGKSVLPHMAKTTPCTTDMHLALLLYCFLENGLLGALTEVIATSDTFISVRATVLLGELLRLIQVLLPPDCCNVSPSLPSLIDYAVRSIPQAIGAVTALQQLHKLMKRRPASYSLHLDFILKSTNNNNIKNTTTKSHRRNRQKVTGSIKSKLHQIVLKDSDDAVKETGVLLSKDAFTWNWNLVNIILKGEDSVKLDLADSSHKSFIKRLIEFFMPSKNKYSHIDLGCSDTSTLYTTTGIQLIHFLVDMKDAECNNLLLELFNDILNNITAISSGKSVHDCLFSPQHMANTQCQSYFLFIGRLATTEVGIQMLNGINMFEKLEHLATTTNHDCYVKLIISSMDHGVHGPGRNILKAVLTCGVENSRLYATQFLLVLLRAGTPSFSKWGVEFLVQQIQDKSKAVQLSALTIMHEACEVTDCLNTFIELNPNLVEFGEKGMLLGIRMLSTINGFEKLNEDGKVVETIKSWDETYVRRYVKMTEADIADALTLHQRGVDGKYDKRTTSVRAANRKDLFLSPHLYGQLSQHQDGLNLLLKHGSVDNMASAILNNNCSTEEETLIVKGAIWAIGHMASSVRGFDVINSRGLLDGILNLAQNATVYSVRATAFYSLGLIATTKVGADTLYLKGWLCTRHNRHDCWPIIEDEIESITKHNMRRRHNTATSEGSVSVENPFTCEFECIEEDIPSDFLSIIDSPEFKRVSFPKQSTLPINKKPQNVFHKRSYSESKTQDLNGYAESRLKLNLDKQHARYRNNSVTDSTTSGVSSCDSLVAGKVNTICEHTQTLSPIPSSSSLSTLQLRSGPQRFHRHSECSQRISSQSDSNSEVSSYSNYPTTNKLSYQDLVGYTTIRALRRSPKLEEEDWPGDMANQLLSDMQNNLALLDDFKNMDPSIKSVFSLQKFPLNPWRNKNEEKIYRGICLPQVLSVLFPEPQIPSGIANIVEEELGKSNENSAANFKSSTSSKHCTEYCLKCCTLNAKDVTNFITDGQKLDALECVERLANPVSSKYFRQVLLHHRQKNNYVFKDLCMYSEALKMMSENSYRLAFRRMLHELFLSVDYSDLWKVASKEENNVEEVKLDINLASGSNSSSTTSAVKVVSPTLDSLKLIYKENKFPIRDNK